jgi:hypothetical protein
VLHKHRSAGHRARGYPASPGLVNVEGPKAYFLREYVTPCSSHIPTYNLRFPRTNSPHLGQILREDSASLFSGTTVWTPLFISYYRTEIPRSFLDTAGTEEEPAYRRVTICGMAKKTFDLPGSGILKIQMFQSQMEGRRIRP